jgi:hypothetical protein
MNRYPSLALHLPLKVFVWESEDGAVWLSYNSPELLQERHGLHTPPFGVLANLVQQRQNRENRRALTACALTEQHVPELRCNAKGTTSRDDR